MSAKACESPHTESDDVSICITAELKDKIEALAQEDQVSVSHYLEATLQKILQDREESQECSTK